eukprot:CAMPEP_0177190766 /NCGR_PEP_ID=MMETSP0367-20130122/20998_1 /TAXON_ID=447022 ORGANISM="Scrippsiella hangoei-like, Strain SHHI-4" /NCGR_SAMPLE_ID=MMETSP0367 /ASSEMBLY_ACC=CAM_ASM_000362 /LENGTH=213 /DNA_ID=CAMNT_0018638435 /DNA_START=75 /DNA_END=717 /DNA_ORIENTATION=+
MASALYVFLLLVTAGASASLAEDAACAHGSTCTAGADEPAEDGAAMLQLPAAGPSLYEANTTVDVKLHKPQLMARNANAATTTRAARAAGWARSMVGTMSQPMAASTTTSSAVHARAGILARASLARVRMGTAGATGAAALRTGSSAIRALATVAAMAWLGSAGSAGVAAPFSGAAAAPRTGHFATGRSRLERAHAVVVLVSSSSKPPLSGRS